MVVKGFHGEKLIIKAELDHTEGRKHHHNIELWYSKTKLCDMHVANNFIHIFRNGDLEDVFVNLE